MSVMASRINGILLNNVVWLITTNDETSNNALQSCCEGKSHMFYQRIILSKMLALCERNPPFTYACFSRKEPVSWKVY